MPKPTSVKIEDKKDSFEISVKWNMDHGLIGVLASFFLMMVFFAALSSADAGLLTIMFPLIVLIAAYFSLSQVFNSTYFWINQNFLVVEHGPIPTFSPTRRINIQDIDQLYVRRIESSNNGKEQVYYSLNAKLTSKMTVELIEKLPFSKEEARYVEQKLEERLGITDRIVPGEIRDEEEPPSPVQQRRAALRTTRPADIFLPSSTNEEEVVFDGRSYQANESTRFDWHDGSSDRLLQLTDADGKERQLYVLEVPASSLSLRRKAAFQRGTRV